MVTQYQHAKKDEKHLKNLPSGELLFSALLSTDELDTTCWVIGDVSTEFYNVVAGMPKGAEKNQLVEEECEEIAARTMLDTKENVDDAGVKGVLDGTVRMFISQAKMASVAYAGNNLVLAGDAVGAGHWAVGGGMHVAGMCHQKRLDALAADLLAGADRHVALKEYSDDALKDTEAWISMSMEFYYLSIPKEVVDAVFTDVMTDFEKDKNINAPDEMKKRIISVYFGSKYDTDPVSAGFDATL